MDSPELPPLTVREPGSDGFGSEPAGPPRTTWTDESDQPIGRMGVAGETCWIELDGIGVYWFHLISGGVEAEPAAAASREIVADSYRRSVLPHVLQARGLQVLHASAICVADEVVGLCGTSGVGKSTLAQGLAQRGYPAWADDALTVECGSSGCVSFQLPFRLRLADDSTGDVGPQFEIAESDSASRTGLRALVLLRRLEQSAMGDGDFQWNRLESADAFHALLPHAYWLDVGDTVQRRSMIETYLQVADRVPIFDCAFVPDRARLGDLICRLEDAVNNI